MNITDLQGRSVGSGIAQPTRAGWRLNLGSTSNRAYSLAQLDDRIGSSRRNLPWRAPLTLRLKARVSRPNLRGTWGFGFWNDPFGFAVSPMKHEFRMPTLPQAAWFFFSSPKSYLSLHDEGPANGLLAQVFRSAKVGAWMLAAAVSLATSRRRLRRILRRHVHEEAARVMVELEDWHAYELLWHGDGATFAVDGGQIMETQLAPAGALGMVIWIDNQFAAFDPQGRLAWGFEASPEPSWLEIEELSCGP